MKCEQCHNENKMEIKIKVTYTTPEDDGWEEDYEFCSLS